jgi:hypothetical protein
VSVVDAVRARGGGRWFFALPLIPFGGVVLALLAGASRARWLPVAGLLAVTATGDVYFWVGAQLRFRRSARQRQADVPWGVEHRAPFWMSLMNVLLALATGAVIAAVPAALGFPRVGAGVLAIFAIVAVGVPFAVPSPRALTFEPRGLRCHVRGGSVVVSWSAITKVDYAGPDHAQVILLHVADADAVIASHEPQHPALLPRIQACIGRDAGGTGQVMLMPWTGGLDGPSLRRALDGAMRGQTGAARA